MKIEITPAQLEAIKHLADDISAMIGSNGEEDQIWERKVMLIDRMLKKNNLAPRDFN